MSEFIIDDALEKVKSIETKDYLNEVISSFNNQNYRSAIVVLYSVVIFDLLNKLLLLRDVYNDENAINIINEVEEMQKKNPISPKWEEYLIKQIKDRTQLLNKIEADKIDNLKYYRNLCAHPIYDQNYKLVNPTKEEARALIRNCFEAVFLKDALLCIDIFGELLNDANNHFDRVKTNGLEKHLKYTYYNRMNQAVKDQVFDKLWKFVFILDDENCNKNRLANYYALIYLVKEDRKHYLRIVNDKKEKYCKIKLSDKKIKYDSYLGRDIDTPISALIYFISEYEEFYDVLSDGAKNIINIEVEKNFYYGVRATYLSYSIEEHIEKIKSDISKICSKGNYYDCESYDCLNLDDLDYLMRSSEEKCCGDVILDYIVYYFSNSKSYRGAVRIFENIKPFIKKLNKDQIVKLLEGMNSNSQIYENNEIHNMKKEVKDYCKEMFGSTFDYKRFSNLW